MFDHGLRGRVFPAVCDWSHVPHTDVGPGNDDVLPTRAPCLMPSASLPCQCHGIAAAEIFSIADEVTRETYVGKKRKDLS